MECSKAHFEYPPGANKVDDPLGCSGLTCYDKKPNGEDLQFDTVQ